MYSVSMVFTDHPYKLAVVPLWCMIVIESLKGVYVDQAWKSGVAMRVRRSAWEAAKTRGSKEETTHAASRTAATGATFQLRELRRT